MQFQNIQDNSWPFYIYLMIFFGVILVVGFLANLVVNAEMKADKTAENKVVNDEYLTAIPVFVLIFSLVITGLVGTVHILRTNDEIRPLAKKNYTLLEDAGFEVILADHIGVAGIFPIEGKSNEVKLGYGGKYYTCDFIAIEGAEFLEVTCDDMLTLEDIKAL